jgi:hypothetical protein
MPSSRSLTADNPQVESTFQIHNDFYGRSLPETKAPFEPSSPFHKVDSFSSWNAGLPKIPSTNKTDEAEQNLEKNMELSHDDLSGSWNGLSGHRLQDADLDFPIMPMIGYAAYNQESHGRTSTVEGEAPGNMVSCIVSNRNETPVLRERYFRWQLGPSGSKDSRLEGGSSLTEDPALYCGLLPNTGEVYNLFAAPPRA